MLNDDLAPRPAGASTAPRGRVVSARAEILDASGSPVGTLYLDDRGDRYLTLDAGADGAAATEFGLAARPEARSAPVPLARDVAVPARLHLAACR